MADIIWIQLKKDFFNLSKNIFICFTYINPSDSDYYKNNNFTSDDLFEYIRQDCAELRPKGNILLMGDINAYLPVMLLTILQMTLLMIMFHYLTIFINLIIHYQGIQWKQGI